MRQSECSVTDAVETEGSLKSTKFAMDKKMKYKSRPPPPPPGIKDDLTIIAHLSLVIYVMIICYLCLANPFTFFTWHPFLLTIGVSLKYTKLINFCHFFSF